MSSFVHPVILSQTRSVIANLQINIEQLCAYDNVNLKADAADYMKTLVKRKLAEYDQYMAQVVSAGGRRDRVMDVLNKLQAYICVLINYNVNTDNKLLLQELLDEVELQKFNVKFTMDRQ